MYPLNHVNKSTEVEWIKLIWIAKEMGMTIEEIRSFLQINPLKHEQTP
ncbi:anti-repressor SinI family protein [Aquibacillus kalidii]|nr:anti-repressor SinI family protein [Aquibacillus kalidii]